MSQRLSEVVMQETATGYASMSLVTRIPKLGYQEQVAESLWHLKPGEELNDEVFNAYLELLQRSRVSADQSIKETGILNLKPNRP
jgi:hypothetical protein